MMQDFHPPLSRARLRGKGPRLQSCAWMRRVQGSRMRFDVRGCWPIATAYVDDLRVSRISDARGSEASPSPLAVRLEPA